MSYRRSCTLPRSNGSCFYLLHVSGRIQRHDLNPYRSYCAQKQTPPDKPPFPQEQMLTSVKNVVELGKQWGGNAAKMATAAVNNWWGKYEEFVGLNEVRDAQSKVTEAEKSFMVARGMVREAHTGLEALQVRLKEVRDRLDRVSREEAHYLELATMEHKLLQEERRLKTAYETAEGGEREKFALFSAGVRESHEKERARAERTKNWSIIGSVLGTIIGVMGSTYVNRVRLQELKSLLLEAQKGPASLQDVIKAQAESHKGQQEALRDLIDKLKLLVDFKAAEKVKIASGSEPGPRSAALVSEPRGLEETVREVLLQTRRTGGAMEALKPQVEELMQNVGRMAGDVQAVKTSMAARRAERSGVQTKDVPLLVLDTESLKQGLDQTEKRLEAQINKTTVYNTILTYTAFALTLPVLYVIFKCT